MSNKFKLCFYDVTARHMHFTPLALSLQRKTSNETEKFVVHSQELSENKIGSQIGIYTVRSPITLAPNYKRQR